MDGGAEGVRTPDLLNAIQALYQLSYDPVQSAGNVRCHLSDCQNLIPTQDDLVGGPGWLDSVGFGWTRLDSLVEATSLANCRLRQDWLQAFPWVVLPVSP